MHASERHVWTRHSPSRKKKGSTTTRAQTEHRSLFLFSTQGPRGVRGFLFFSYEPHARSTASGSLSKMADVDDDSSMRNALARFLWAESAPEDDMLQVLYDWYIGGRVPEEHYHALRSFATDENLLLQTVFVQHFRTELRISTLFDELGIPGGCLTALNISLGTATSPFEWKATPRPPVQGQEPSAEYSSEGNRRGGARIEVCEILPQRHPLPAVYDLPERFDAMRTLMEDNEKQAVLAMVQEVCPTSTVILHHTLFFPVQH